MTETRAGASARPKRIQRQRTKGWRMPEGAVYVGRPTMWGNPFTVVPQGSDAERAGMPTTAREAIRRYRDWLRGREDASMFGNPPRRFQIRMLRGKDLACWCPLDQSCHADVLLELANAD